MALNESLALRNMLAFALNQEAFTRSITANLLEEIAATYPDEKDGGIPAPLSFLVWDLTENNKQALDYQRDRNMAAREYVSGLFKQAEEIVSTRSK